jgi:hypothetical protein
MTTIASKVDLRYIDTPILNQAPLNTCSENTLQTTLDIMMRLAGHEIAPISRMQSYYDARVEAGMLGPQYGDIGTVSQTMLDVAKTKGLAPESLWDYSPAKLYDVPTQAVYDVAAQHKLTGYTTIATNQNPGSLYHVFSQALAEGKPILLSFNTRGYLYNEQGPLETIDSGGGGPQMGGHMLAIVGKSAALGAYIVQNSGGTGWGDNGYGLISYGQLVAYPDDFKAAYVLDGFDGLDFKWTDARVNVAQHYAAVLGRAAELPGLDWWASTGLSDVALTGGLLGSAEGVARYGALNDAQFVEAMYDSVLNRHSDPGGLSFYTGLLAQGMSRADVMGGVINAVDTPGAEAAAHDYLLNLTNLSSFISITMQYGGGHDTVTAAALDAVTASADAVEIIKTGLPELLHG